MASRARARSNGVPATRAPRARARASARSRRAHTRPRRRPRARRTPPRAAPRGPRRRAAARWKRDQLDDLVAAAAKRRLDPLRDGPCMRARSRRGRLSYATSQISACLKISSRWPLIDEARRLRMRSRPCRRSSSSLDRAGVEPGDLARPRPARTRGPRRPRPAARASRRPAAGRCARRARRARCRAAPSPACRARVRTISSRKNGLPSARATIARALALADAVPSSSSTSRALSPASSGSTASPVKLRAPAAPGRPPRRQLGPGGAEHEQRALGMSGDVLEQLEHGGVGPLDVLDDARRSARAAASAEKNERHASCVSARTSCAARCARSSAARPMLAVSMPASSAGARDAGARERGLGSLEDARPRDARQSRCRAPARRP